MQSQNPHVSQPGSTPQPKPQPQPVGEEKQKTKTRRKTRKSHLSEAQVKNVLDTFQQVKALPEQQQKALERLFHATGGTDLTIGILTRAKEVATQISNLKKIAEQVSSDNLLAVAIVSGMERKDRNHLVATLSAITGEKVKLSSNDSVAAVELVKKLNQLAQGPNMSVLTSVEKFL